MHIKDKNMVMCSKRDINMNPFFALNQNPGQDFNLLAHMVKICKKTLDVWICTDEYFSLRPVTFNLLLLALNIYIALKIK